MKHIFSIDLTKLSLQIRNEIVNIVKQSRCYYSLELQIISFSEIKTIKKVSEML